MHKELINKLIKLLVNYSSYLQKYSSVRSLQISHFTFINAHSNLQLHCHVLWNNFVTYPRPQHSNLQLSTSVDVRLHFRPWVPVDESCHDNTYKQLINSYQKTLKECFSHSSSVIVANKLNPDSLVSKVLSHLDPF